MTHRTATALALALALAAALAASLPAGAQTARLGSLPPSAQVVTNEQDAAALAALNATNAVLRAALTNEAALRAAGDAAGLAALYGTNAVLRAALTNEAALRVEGDAAGLAALYGTNAVLRAALTNEAALRAAGDAAGLAALYATKAAHGAALTNEAALRVEGDAAGLAALYGTNAVLRAALTNEAALRAEHADRADNPHGVTAPQIGALTTETDEAALAALSAYAAYWPRNATASSWFTFTTNANEITITGYNIAGGTDVVIPDYINGLPVTEIGVNAFAVSGVTSIGGAGNVVAVGTAAFYYCAMLTSVSLPQVQTVGSFAFEGCGSLTSLYFDNDAPIIRSGIFIEITPNQVTNYVTNPQATGWGATFDGMPVVRPPLYADAIYQAGELVATTAALAVHTNRTDNPHGVTAPQIGALTNELDLAALRTYHYGSPDIVESPAGWFDFDGAGTITAFNWQAGRENVVIPWEIGGVPVTTIGAEAFRMSGIVSVSAPQTVTSIGDSAFASCTSLTSLSLSQVQTVGIHAFYFCTSLTSISLPQATAIDDYAFYGCGTLKSVSLPQATAIGGYAFRSCGSLPSVSLPQAQTVGDGAFSDCSLLASINLPQITSIGEGAFYHCPSLTSVTIPQAASIGDNAFYGCRGLTAVRMGQNAPAEATGVFSDITPPPTVYVTDPQATGWGAVWNGAPVVRPPLYGSNVVAQAYTLNGDTITEWPSGGGATNITDGVTHGTYDKATRTIDISNLLAGVSMELPDGIVTNGSAADLNSLDVQGSITIGGDTTYNTWARHTYEAVYPQYPHLYAQGLVFDNANSRQLRIFHVASDGTGGITFLTGTSTGSMVERMRIPTASGFVGIGTNAPAAQLHVAGNSLVSGTNTAAEVRSTGGYIIGPTISGKQAHIFTDGTNTFQVDVNDLTNQFATVADVTGIIAPLIASGTNITVTSTQSVYSVAVTNAGPVGIDWSGLALDGTGRAEITLRLNVTEWGGTNVTFAPSLTFDRTPEILVTGVWEFAASTIDGVTTRVRQTWPEAYEWATASYAYASGWAPSLYRTGATYASTNSLMCVCPPAPLLLIRPDMRVNANKPTSFSYGFSTYFMPQTSVPAVVYGPFSVGHGYTVKATHAVENPSKYGLVQIWVGNSSPDSIADVLLYPGRTSIRPANANERAAYEAGWRP